MSNIVIEGVEYVEAPEVRTSLEIESQFKGTIEKLGIPENFIEIFSGVSTRREWPVEVDVATVATLSAKKLLDRLEIDPNEIGIIINTSLSRDYTEPTTSVIVHDKLGLNDRCINFDLNNACMGFSNAVNVVSSLLKTNQIKYGLIICGESFRRFVNLAIDRLSNIDISLEDFMLEFATLTLGSGSVSMVLCREEDSKYKHIIKGQIFVTDSRYNMSCRADHYQMVCDSRKMLKEGIAIVDKTRDVCNIEFPDWPTIDRFFPHQISMSHMKVLQKIAGIDLNKMEITLPYLGNLAAAAWPVAIAIAEKEGRLIKGMNIGVQSMGSGFNCSFIGITW